MLHIVSKSPHNSSALRDCLRLCRHDDMLLLIEDGVYAAVTHGDELLRATPGVRVLREDLMARGIAERADVRIATVDYIGFVQLCCDNNPIQSWF
jgi:tRNA 2-thiouridine synthesizing protein B